MNIRFFDWRDLPVLLRYRRRGFFFDSAQLLTRGPMLVPAGALLSFFAPATGIFTYLCSEDRKNDPPLLGQVMHNAASPYARLSFLAPESALESGGMPALIEHMVVKVGERGALHLLAEVDEDTVAFEALRHLSFAIFARQRIWRLMGAPVKETSLPRWRACNEGDLLAIRTLYNNLVPGMVQQVELPAAVNLHGLVCRQGGELIGYVEVKPGPRGIWVQPFIHPDVEGITDHLSNLLQSIPQGRSRPVYLCIRSYQAWLEPAVGDLGGKAGPRQAVMVKHLAVAKKVVRSFALRPIEGKQPEATAPIVRSENKNQA